MPTQCGRNKIGPQPGTPVWGYSFSRSASKTKASAVAWKRSHNDAIAAAECEECPDECPYSWPYHWYEDPVVDRPVRIKVGDVMRRVGELPLPFGPWLSTLFARLFGNFELWATKARVPWGVIVVCHNSKDVEPENPPTEEEILAPR